MGDVTLASSTPQPSTTAAAAAMAHPSIAPSSTTNASDIALHTVPTESINNFTTEFSNSTFIPVTSDPGGQEELSLPVIIGLAVGSFALLILIVVVVIGVYHRKRRKKLPTGKLKMGPRHAVQPEQYPGLFDDRDDIVSLSYINVHMPQPKRTKEEDIISLDSDGYLNSLENPMYECHHPKSCYTRPPSSSCTEM